MAGIVSRVVDLRAGEAGMVARFAATLFGLISAHTMLETARDTLFLENLPVSRLTFVYAALALLTLFAAKTNSRFVSAFGRRNSLIFTLLGSTFGTVMLYLLEPTRGVIFGLYVWSGLLGSILVVQFWMFVGHAFTVSQGKRLYGLLAAGGVLGAVAGAGLSAAILDYIDVRELLVISSMVFLATAFFVTGHEVDEVPREEPQEERTRTAVRGALGLVGEYPYLLRLTLLVAISTATVLATDYLFKSVAASTIPPEQLGSFFARYYTVLNSVALVVQLFVSSAVVQRAGVIGAFLLLPLLLAIGGGASLALGGGIAVLATKGADGSLRHSLHRIASELLWMPLPEHVRTRAKGTVDTVVVRGTQAALAGILFALATVDLDTPEILAGLVAALAVAWLGLGWMLRKPYLDLFRAALNQRGERGRLELDLRSVEVVVESLSSRDPQQAIAAIDLLAASGRTRLIPALILYHESEEVLLRALEVVPLGGRRDWVPLAERLLKHDHAAVRVAALEALAQNGHHEGIKGRLLDISPWVRAHAAFWLAQLSDNPQPADDGSIKLILEMSGPSGRQARVGLLEAVHASGDPRWSDLLLELADSDELEVSQASLQAMTRIHDRRFIPLLLRRLGVREGRSTVRGAIVALGDPAFDALVHALEDPETPPQLRAHLPATIARFGHRRAADVLMKALESADDGRLRYKALRGLGFLSTRAGVELDRVVLERRILHDLQEHYRMAALHLQLEQAEPAAANQPDDAPLSSEGLLKGLLADKRDQALDRVFLLLQASFPHEDLRSVRVAARSHEKQRRAQAQEFLDALTRSAATPELRTLLRLAVDDLPLAEVLERARVEIDSDLPSDLESALRALLDDRDTAVSNLAAYHVLEAGLPTPGDSLRDRRDGSSLTDDLRELARRLGGGGAREAPGLA